MIERTFNAKTGEITEREVPDIEFIDSVELQIPTSITMRQTKLALLSKGLLDVIENAITNMNDKAAEIEWQNSSVVERDNLLVNNMCSFLGMSKEDIDEFFIFANTL